MSVSIINSPQNKNSGDTYTPETGSNLAVLVISCIKTGSDATNTCSTITLGSTSKAPIAQGSNTVLNSVAAALFTGSEIAVGAVSSSWSTAPVTQKLYCITLSGSSGLPSLLASNSGWDGDNVAVSAIVGSIVIGAISCRTGTAVTTDTTGGFTEIFDELMSGSDGACSLATNTADATTETYIATNGGESLALALSFTEVATGGATRLLDDFLTLIDQVSIGALKGRTSEEFSVLTEDFLRSLRKTIALDELGTLSEDPNAYFIYDLTADETLTLYEDFLVGITRGATITDTSGVVDDILRFKLAPRILDDTLSLSEDYTKNVRLLLVEALNVVDMLAALSSGGSSYAVVINDTVTVVDVLTGAVVYSRQLDNPSVLFDSTATSIVYVRDTDDLGAVSENLAVSAQYARNLIELSTLMDDLIALYQPFTQFTTTPRIVLGAQFDFIVLGGYQ